MPEAIRWPTSDVQAARRLPHGGRFRFQAVGTMTTIGDLIETLMRTTIEESPADAATILADCVAAVAGVTASQIGAVRAADMLARAADALRLTTVSEAKPH